MREKSPTISYILQLQKQHLVLLPARRHFIKQKYSRCLCYTGHGKLLLGDGGHYEGTFVKGEMEGHGYRFVNTAKLLNLLTLVIVPF